MKENILKVYKIKTKDYQYNSFVFKLIKDRQEFANKNVYIYRYSKQEKWEQNDLLATELAGDMKCLIGGYEEWKNDQEAYLIVNPVSIKEIEEPKQVVSFYNVGFYNTYYLIKHRTD